MTVQREQPASEYLQAIYEMAEENIPTIQARLSDWMGMSRASVSEAVNRLVRDGLLVKAGKRLEFTKGGERLARDLVRRHRLAEHFLIRVIGLPWHRSHDEAGRWERVISPEVEERIAAILDDPPTCPHGNPIPGSKHATDHSDLVPLKEVPAGTHAVLRRLTEDLELELDVMRFLEDSGLMPGAEIAVLGIGPDGAMSLRVAERPVALGAHLCDNLWVQLDSVPADRRS